MPRKAVSGAEKLVNGDYIGAKIFCLGGFNFLYATDYPQRRAGGVHVIVKLACQHLILGVCVGHCHLYCHLRLRITIFK